jgi:hypothetical protein
MYAAGHGAGLSMQKKGSKYSQSEMDHAWPAARNGPSRLRRKGVKATPNSRELSDAYVLSKIILLKYTEHTAHNVIFYSENVCTQPIFTSTPHHDHNTKLPTIPSQEVAAFRGLPGTDERPSHSNPCFGFRFSGTDGLG